MSKFLRKLLGKESYPIVVSQYKRSNFGVGNEEDLHWAIVIMTDEDKLEGRMYQAVNRINDTRDGVTWDISTAEKVSLERSSRCLGGVCIGVVKQKELSTLDKALLENAPLAKSTEWNCRDWVMECIAIMKDGGWVADGIYRQQDLIPAMKQASALTVEVGQPALVDFDGA
ncbi:hypothetical protein C8Q73DRAFT_796037 [Cubamyces lactineus]|nr:hypothetical protein C8Q73DRAFT_796037 [Cubamyces lactineus]